MMTAYAVRDGRLAPVSDAELDQAIWIDLYRPLDSQVAKVEALGLQVPTLADMEEIEISNRLFRQGDTDYMTAVLPGELPGGPRVAMPVSFILSPVRLVTVRHHAPRPFATFPERADRSTAGCASPDRLFLSLIEEIIARLADILEGTGRVLDEVTAQVFGGRARGDTAALQHTLERVGTESETMAKVRLGLLSLERLLAFHAAAAEPRDKGAKRGLGRTHALVKAQLRDIQALEVHADYLASRVGLTVDATLGMINLQQNGTVRILSVIAALFLPPTLIASIYGMNFEWMPELQWEWGYPAALGLMLASAVSTWLFLRWKRWL